MATPAFEHGILSPAATPQPPHEQTSGFDSAFMGRTLEQLLPTEPSPGALPPPVITPPASENCVPDMFSLLGGPLAPVHTSPPCRQQFSRSAHNLRLPSFELLGIGAPHPDRFGSLSFHDIASTASAFSLMTAADGDATPLDSEAVSAMHALETALPLAAAMPTKPRLPPGMIQASFPHDVATLTPPADAEPACRATILANFSNATVNSGSSDLNSLLSAAARSSDERPVAVAKEENVEPDSTEDSIAWIDGALDILVNNIRSAAIPNNPLRVLSHALPVPSDDGHIYNTILERIGANTPSNPPTWINVFHAIPGKFNLPDIPTSPPSTPGTQSGDDYFTQKIFASAVPIADYQDDPSTLPRSPRPIVPPSTVNLAVVERYIPPSSSNEFKNLFNPSGPSLLVDRLVELSPDGGTLVFIYPTKTGAETFMREYLSPILDPLLRTTQVVHGLSWSLSQDLGTMAAAKDMEEFEQMRRSLQTLCARLAQRKRGSYATVYASKACVRIGRAAWAKDWWPKQEYPRIKETVTRATQEALRKSSNQHIERASTATELVGHLVEGVLKNPYPSGQEPTSGIEVSIFVVQRSA